MGDLFGGLAVLAFFAMIYFAPSIVANVRGHSNLASIVVLNLLLGWTVLGWIVAMVWAYSAQKVVATGAPASTPAQRNKICPFCAETIKSAATVCRFCSKDLPAAATTEAAASPAEPAYPHGIIFDGDRYQFEGYKYERLDHAINYAERTLKARGAL